MLPTLSICPVFVIVGLARVQSYTYGLVASINFNIYVLYCEEFQQKVFHLIPIETNSANMPTQTSPASPTEAVNPSSAMGQQPDTFISKDVFVHSPVPSDSEDSFRESQSEGNHFPNSFVSPCNSAIDNEFCLDDLGMDSTSLDNLYPTNDSDFQGLDLSVGQQDFTLSSNGILDLKLNGVADDWKPSDVFENFHNETADNDQNKSGVKVEYDESDLLDLSDVDTLQFDLEDSLADASMRQTNTFITAPNAQGHRKIPGIAEEDALLNLSMLGSVFANHQEEKSRPPPPLVHGYLPFVCTNSPGNLPNMTYSTNEMVVDQNSHLNVLPPNAHQQSIMNEINSLTDFLMVPSDKNSPKSPARLAPCSTLLPDSKITTTAPGKQNAAGSNNLMLHGSVQDEVLTNAMSANGTEILGASVFGDGVTYGFVGVNPGVNLTRNGIFTSNEALMFPQQFHHPMVSNANVVNASSPGSDILSQSCEIIQSDSNFGLGSHACHPNGQECLAWACKACKRKSGPHDR